MNPTPTYTHIVDKIIGFRGLQDGCQWKCSNSVKIWAVLEHFHWQPSWSPRNPMILPTMFVCVRVGGRGGSQFGKNMLLFFSCFRTFRTVFKFFSPQCTHYYYYTTLLLLLYYYYKHQTKQPHLSVFHFVKSYHSSIIYPSVNFY